MRVLLSVKPEYAAKIFSGEKKYEFRKAIYRDSDVRSCVVYATMPIGKVIGEFDVAAVHAGRPMDIWHLTRSRAGINWSFFMSYFRGRTRAYAIEIGSTVRFEVPLDLVDVLGHSNAPQSFVYLPERAKQA